MKLKENLILRKIGEDYVIVDPLEDSVDMTKIYSFNETSAWIWEQLQGKEFTPESIADMLTEHYDVSYEVAIQDVQPIIKFFQEQNLLQE